MAMKVYLSGDNVIVEKTATATVTIPQNRAQYVFIGTNTNDPNVSPTFTNVEVSDFLLIEELRNDTIGNVQTQAGATVGSFDDVQRYLATFINRGSSVLLPADADVIVVGGATAANQETQNSLLQSIVDDGANKSQQQSTNSKLDLLAKLTDTQPVSIIQDGANVGKNNGAWVKFSNDSITKSASGALLVNTPSILFDGKTLNADDTNFLWQGVGTGTGTWANNMFSMSVTAGQYYIRQSRRFMPYFSGYPVLAELTFDNFDIQANGTKRLGYFSSSAVAPHTANLDGFWLEMDGTTYRMVSYNNGTQTTNIAFASFTNYATLSGYNFDNFTAIMFSFLWLGGAQLALWICTADDGWILANLTPYVGNNKGTICRSPNQPLRYEVRSTTGTLDFRQVCSQVSVSGNIEKLGYSLPSINTAVIPCNTVGTLYALQGFKKNATYRDIAVKITSLGCVNAATSDTGILMIIRNPTLSAALTYAAYGKIDRAIATNQTVTIGTGDIIAVATTGGTGNANADLVDNYKSWLTQTITNTFDEYVLCYLSASNNQDVRGYAILKEY